MLIAVHEDRFEIPRRTYHALLAASVCWFSLEGLPLLPIGLLLTIRYVGRNFDLYFLRSIWTGWRVIGASLFVALLGLPLGPMLDFSTIPHFGFALRLPPLLLRLNVEALLHGW